MSPRRGHPLPRGFQPHPAPDELRVIQELVNTRDLGTGHDALKSPEELKVWLATRELLPAGESVGDEQLHDFLALREGLRELIHARTLGTRPEPSVISHLRRTVAGIEVPHHFLFEPDGSLHLAKAVPAGWPGAITGLLVPVVEAMRDGGWRRLKECRCETCRRIFYDRSASRTGKWCNPRRCGNRINTEIYRRRKPVWKRR